MFVCPQVLDPVPREPNGSRRRTRHLPWNLDIPGRCRASDLSRFGGCWSPRGPRRCCPGRAGLGRSVLPQPKTGWLWRSGPPAVMATRKVRGRRPGGGGAGCGRASGKTQHSFLHSYSWSPVSISLCRVAGRPETQWLKATVISLLGSLQVSL